jgi:hypothetical protein
MKKKSYLYGVVLAAIFMMIPCSSQAESKAAPMADASKMMLEHVDMDCTVCHGAAGPKGMKASVHPKQKCTDCHVQGVTKALTRKEKRSTLPREMMLKHGASLQCKFCHGEGPKGVMMMEHVGMDCQTCHVVGER